MALSTRHLSNTNTYKYKYIRSIYIIWTNIIIYFQYSGATAISVSPDAKMTPYVELESVWAQDFKYAEQKLNDLPCIEKNNSVWIRVHSCFPYFLFVNEENCYVNPPIQHGLYLCWFFIVGKCGFVW